MIIKDIQQYIFAAIFVLHEYKLEWVVVTKNTFSFRFCHQRGLQIYFLTPVKIFILMTNFTSVCLRVWWAFILYPSPSRFAPNNLAKSCHT